MLECLLVLLGIISLFLWMQKIYPDDGIKSVILSGAGFFAGYVILSACLFWGDVFSIRRVLVILDCLLSCSVLVGILQKKLVWRPVQMPWREYGIPVAVIVCMLPFVMHSFGFYGMSQDQGVYQTHALFLMNDQTAVQMDLEEYQLLTDADEQARFVQTVQEEFVGYYTGEEFGGYPTYGADEYVSPVAGIFHGIPNFAAVLALSGRMFGVAHMMGIQILFWAGSIILVYLTGKNLRWKSMTNLLAVGILAVCPEVIWTTKSALTEPFLLLLMAAWVYFMTEERRHSLWGAAAAMITFSFFHITAFMYVLMAYILFLIHYYRTEKKESLMACGGMVIGFCIGFTMMACVSPRYTYLNMSFSLYRILPFLTDRLCLPFVWIVCLLGLGVLCGLARWGKPKKMAAFLESQWTVRLFQLVIVGMMLWQMYLYGKQVAAGQSLRLGFQQMSISAFAYMTGCLILPLTILLFFIKGKELLENVSGMLLCGAFLYCVLFYVSFLRPTISYYYYARYLAPYIPLVVVCAGLCLDKWSRYSKGVLLAVSVLLLLPSDLVLLRQMDDTLVEWDTLEELASLVETEDVVIVEKDDSRRLYLPIKAMTGAKVFVRYGDLSEQILRVKQEEGKIYYLANACSFVDDSVGEMIWKEHYQESEDLEDKGGRWIPFPTGFTVTERVLALYSCDPEYRTNYEMSRKDFRLEGFDKWEEGFRWTIQDVVDVGVCLERADYRMTIRCMMGIPEQVLAQNKPYEIRVFLDGTEVGGILVEDSSQTEFSLEIPAEMIQDKEMILSLDIPLWNASLVTPGDDRQLGLSIQAIDFEVIHP